jgi:hypothetical protein
LRGIAFAGSIFGWPIVFAWPIFFLSLAAPTPTRAGTGNEGIREFEASLAVSGVLLVPVEPALSGNEPTSSDQPAGELIPWRVVEQPVRAESKLSFFQRGQVASSSLRWSEQEQVVLRHYREAEGRLSVGEGKITTRLPAGIGPVRVRLAGATPQAWLANGFLSQPEHDLLAMPFDPLLLSALGPPLDSGEGDLWPVDADAVAGLLCIDTVAAGEMLVTVEQMTEAEATLSLRASIVGAVDGASTEIELAGSCQWAFAGTSPPGMTQLEVVIRESRQPGPVGPGLAVDAALQMTSRRPASELGKAEAVTGAGWKKEKTLSAPGENAAPIRPRRGPGQPGCLWLTDSYDRFDLVYPVQWKVIEQGAERVVLRLVDHGALIGQVTIFPLPPNGVPLSLGILQRDIERSLADQFSHLLKAAESQRSDGTRILRVVSAGEADGLPFQWIHYHLAAENGQRVSLSFIVETKQVERFGDADQRLVEGLKLSAS